MKFMKDFMFDFALKPAFSSDEARNFFSFGNGPNGYYKTVINNLVRSGKLFRITRGQYTFYDEVQFAGFAFKPFYYGLQDALSLRDLWEQETNPVIITPRNVRSALRIFNERNYVVRWIERSIFFGFSLMKYGEFFIPISGPEKIFIGMVYYREFIPEETKIEIFNSIDPKLFQEYLYRLSPFLHKRVLSAIGNRAQISENFRSNFLG